ncbi:HupE/UreJ family protein [Planktotalea arctica]|uniref:HupE/UreJ family protein n=1 Tax=Planktotalea arctica TaxID=1481893 RepID=UPI001FE6141E|nr:HupE/UreJ family protein [Planktotalea arctica]
MSAFCKVKLMLVQLLLVSSLLVGAPGSAHAHEVSPSVADLTLEGGKVTLDLRLTLESFLAGIDLDSATDTNEVPQAADYDLLRALDPAALERRLRDFAPQMLREVTLSVDGAVVALQIAALDIPETGDVELPRLSQLTLSGAVPENAGLMQVNWGDGYGTLILRQMGPQNPYTGYISGGQSSPEIAVLGGEARGFMSVFGEYIPVGFDHILPKGLDHILFVLGLFFFSTALRPLLIQVTSFTLAHTVTLALGALGLISIPGSIVEPIIAASIVYVAIENVFARKMNPWRPVVIFIFGLLHGLGFASVLGEFGLPADQFIAALIGFNVGVELGQLTVIALAFLAVGYWFGGKDWYRTRIAMPASLLIAAVGAYWFVERVFL